MLSNGIDFPLTHDLEELLRVARKGGLTFPPRVQRIVELTPYAVEARYPGSPDAITKEDVRTAVGLAKQFVKWVKKNLDRSSPSR